MIGARANAHSAEIEAMPGVRAFQQAAEDADYAREQESERVYEAAYEEALRGDRDLSYLVDLMEGDTQDGGLYHQFCDLLGRFQKALDDCSVGPIAFDSHLNEQNFDFEQLGRDVWTLYKNMAERYAEDQAEDV